MAKIEEKSPINTVRRADRAVEDEAWIKALLHRAPFGALATVEDDQPFINTNLFVYDEAAHAIFCIQLGWAAPDQMWSRVEKCASV